MGYDLEQAVRRLVDAGLASPEMIRGCTEEELTEIESLLSLNLPSAYREFLGIMGREAGQFLVGSDYCYPELLSFREATARFLRRHGIESVSPDEIVVFLIHQGYIFLFFYPTSRQADPPVFLLHDSDKAPRKIYDTFSDWLQAALEDDIAAYKELEE
jgi:hypothetical protein